MNSIATTAAIDTTHRVEEEDQEGNELESPFGQLIVTGGWVMTARADRRRPLTRAYADLDGLAVGTEPGVVINETSKVMAAV